MPTHAVTQCSMAVRCSCVCRAAYNTFLEEQAVFTARFPRAGNMKANLRYREGAGGPDYTNGQINEQRRACTPAQIMHSTTQWHARAHTHAHMQARAQARMCTCTHAHTHAHTHSTHRPGAICVDYNAPPLEEMWIRYEAHSVRSMHARTQFTHARTHARTHTRTCACHAAPRHMPCSATPHQ